MPISRILFSVSTETIISLGAQSPALSSSLPAASLSERAISSPLIWPCSNWGLPCHFCYQKRGKLLPHRFTLTLRMQFVGGLFSVALSVIVERLCPDVIWQLARGVRTFLERNSLILEDPSRSSGTCSS